MCEHLHKYIQPKDFQCVGDVAKHCDLSKLCLAVDEAKNFDLANLFCYDFLSDVLQNWFISIDDEKYQQYYNLIIGGDYVVDGKTYHNMGLKKVWIYYSYARYLLINQYNDTPNGTVVKQNDWSIPTPLKEVNDISNKYRNMGKQAYESVLGYLCANKESFPKFDGCGCKLQCGCEGTCNCGHTKKITGFKFSTVRK